MKTQLMLSLLACTLVITNCARKVADAKSSQLESISSEANTMSSYIFIKSKKINTMTNEELQQYRVMLIKYIDLNGKMIALSNNNPKLASMNANSQEALIASQEILAAVDAQMEKNENTTLHAVVGNPQQLPSVQQMVGNHEADEDVSTNEKPFSNFPFSE